MNATTIPCTRQQCLQHTLHRFKVSPPHTLRSFLRRTSKHRLHPSMPQASDLTSSSCSSSCVLIECDGGLLDVHVEGHRVAFNRAFAVRCIVLIVVSDAMSFSLLAPPLTTNPTHLHLYLHTLLTTNYRKWGMDVHNGHQLSTTTYCAWAMPPAQVWCKPTTISWGGR